MKATNSSLAFSRYFSIIIFSEKVRPTHSLLFLKLLFIAYSFIKLFSTRSPLKPFHVYTLPGKLRFIFLLLLQSVLLDIFFIYISTAMDFLQYFGTSNCSHDRSNDCKGSPLLKISNSFRYLTYSSIKEKQIWSEALHI